MAIGSLPASRSAQAASHTWSPTVYMDSTCTPKNNESTAGADALVEALKLYRHEATLAVLGNLLASFSVYTLFKSG